MGLLPSPTIPHLPPPTACPVGPSSSPSTKWLLPWSMHLPLGEPTHGSHSSPHQNKPSPSIHTKHSDLLFKLEKSHTSQHEIKATKIKKTVFEILILAISGMNLPLMIRSPWSVRFVSSGGELACGLLALGNGGEDVFANAGGEGRGGGVGGRKRRLPATIPSQRYQASSSFTRSIPVKATKSSNLPSQCSTNINLNLPTGLYGENKLSKSLLFGQNKRDSNRACAQVESADSEPVYTKAGAELASSDDSVFARASRFGAACYTFLRPFAIRQALISSMCLYARVLNENQLVLQWPLWLKAFPGLIAIFTVHAYGNGINQVFDIDIDRVNKPYLPLVSGELSLKHAWLMMSFGVISGLLIFRLCNADLISTALYCFGLFLATSYSAPPFRFKGSALATTMLLPTVNFVQSVGIFYTANASLGRPIVWSPQTIFILAFSTIFVVVISIIKDIPDVKGDMKYNIRTFPARFGGKNVAYFAVGLLLLNYIGAIAAAILLPQAFKHSVMLPGHIIPPLVLLFQDNNVVLSTSANARADEEVAGRSFDVDGPQNSEQVE
ncbi:hypothetical protein TIFTF001_008880 [Ficus carica]|uniref:Uncharacterized protein n=1 Tax=Ficus carica TaxID=3494 RepID=A0AA87ZT06_FICCA|nr:hypothetical protein TIFTF001_008880 [Ficus carica]